MNRFILTVGFLSLTFFVSGCTTSNLVSSLTGPQEPQAPRTLPVGNTLSMPDDLQLAAPANTTDAYQSNGGQNVLLDGSDLSAAPSALARPADLPKAVLVDWYAQFNINKLKPDGTPKTEIELQEELRLAVLAEKRKTNPNYGTFKNLPNLFRGG